MAIGIYTFKITGTSPILMNNPTSMDGEASLTTRTKKIPRMQEAEIRLYKNEDNQLYVPSIAFLNSLWEGASYQKISKDSARSRIQSSIFVAERETALLDQKTDEPIMNYSIDSRHVVIKATKGRIMRHRPMIENWYCLLCLEIDTDYIDINENIIPLFNKAGRTVGVLDFRPAKRGPFGRYTAELYNGKRMKRK